MKWRLIDKPGKHVVSSGKDQQVGIVLLVDKGGEYGVTVELVGAGAKALMLGLVVGRGREWINLSTETVHQVANTHAETMIHGVMFDQATANISGLIKIVKRAQTVTDFLTERILLLSPSAQAIAEPAPSSTTPIPANGLPIIEIRANGVNHLHLECARGGRSRFRRP